MKKVGILTFHAADNYGAVLQSFALKQTLEKSGCVVSFVDYRPESIQKHYKWRWNRKGLIYGGNVINLLTSSKFSAFRKQHLPLSGGCCETLAQLARSTYDMDVVVFGSDQIWNSFMFGGRLDPAYFGSFLPASIRRVAYAASFGRVDGMAEQVGNLQELLEPFHAVSVRERSGAALLERATGRAPVVALDPTLLQVDFTALQQPVSRIKGRFIFVFALQYSVSLKKAAKELSKRLGLPLVVAQSAATGFMLFEGYKRTVIASPGQWLWLIKHAEHVVTNSFHGTVFSINLRTPFSTIPLEGKMAPRNERMTNLLGMLQLDRRFAGPVEGAAWLDEAQIPIDWDLVGQRLLPYQNESRQFLAESVMGAK